MHIHVNYTFISNTLSSLEGCIYLCTLKQLIHITSLNMFCVSTTPINSLVYQVELESNDFFSLLFSMMNRQLCIYSKEK